MKEKITKTKPWAEDKPKKKTSGSRKRNPMGTAFDAVEEYVAAPKKSPVKKSAMPKTKGGAKSKTPKMDENRGKTKRVDKAPVAIEEMPKKRISAPRNSKKGVKPQVVAPVEVAAPVKAKNNPKSKRKKR